MEKIAVPRQVDVSISVVSHAQVGMVVALLTDLKKQCGDTLFEVILTHNLPENLPFDVDAFPFRTKLITNAAAKGFGANHNQASKEATGKYFCVMNPDIRLMVNPFPALLAHLKNSTAGVIAPLVLGTEGKLEDSARPFPSPLGILRKILGDSKPDYGIEEVPFRPDWVGGMFMLFPMHVFERLGGFDERYFLYYEDVDICARMRMRGYQVAVCADAKVIHNAQRSSHKSLKYTLWHLRSMMRFFFSPVYRQVHRRPKP
jgi:N-acetylglucosaminyl-diphospho-decaprenol L-rhamnosyltransferase